MKDECAEHKQEGWATRRMTKGLEHVKHRQGDGRMGDKGGQPGTLNVLNMSEEGWATRVGGYEVVQVMSMITYITIIYVM